jgi:hypothetical protein
VQCGGFIAVDELKTSAEACLNPAAEESETRRVLRRLRLNAKHRRPAAAAAEVSPKMSDDDVQHGSSKPFDTDWPCLFIAKQRAAPAQAVRCRITPVHRDMSLDYSDAHLR